MLRTLRGKKSGFTLLELIVVIVILAVLAALAIPTFSRVIERTKDETAGISLASIARNAQALRAIDNAPGFTLNHVSESVTETSGSLALGDGLYAAGKFEMAPGAEAVTPGNGATSSTRYGQVAWSLSSDSSTIGLAMRSTTTRCVYVKTQEASSTIWAVSKNKMPSCDAGEALLIEGPNGSVHDPDGSGSGPVFEETELDPDDPGTFGPDTRLPLADTDFCNALPCVSDSLISAKQLRLQVVSSDLDYNERNKYLAVDTDNNRLIAAREDGLYFVNWSTGASQKVWDNAGATLYDMVYFKGGLLFVSSERGLHKFNVTAGGVTLTNADLLGMKVRIDGAPAGVETTFYNLPTRKIAGDVVGGGARIYAHWQGPHEPEGVLYPNTAGSTSQIASFTTDGEYISTLARFSTSSVAAPLAICSISADMNYVYVRASSYSYYGFTAPEDGRSGIWRLAKNASEVNLDETAPWSPAEPGCGLANGSMSAVGSKIFTTNNDQVVSVERTTGDLSFLAGQGRSNGGVSGVGNQAVLSSAEVSSIVGYKNRFFLTNYNGGVGALIVAAPAASTEVNDLESRTLNIPTDAPHTLYTSTGTSFLTGAAADPKNPGRFYTQDGWVDANGLTQSPAQVGIRAGNPKLFGERIYSDDDSWGIRDGNYIMQAPELAQNFFTGCSTFDDALHTRDKNANVYCLTDAGLKFINTSKVADRVEFFPVAGINSALGILDPWSLGLVVDSNYAYVIKNQMNEKSSTEVWKIDYKQGAAPTLLTEVQIPETPGFTISDIDSFTASADHIYLPAVDRVVRVNKASGAQDNYPSAEPGAAVAAVVHDGVNLYYGAVTGGLGSDDMRTDIFKIG